MNQFGFAWIKFKVEEYFFFFFFFYQFGKVGMVNSLRQMHDIFK